MDQPKLQEGALTRPNFQERNYAPLKVKIISHNDLDGHAPSLIAADFFWSYHPESRVDIENIGDYDKVDDHIIAFTESDEAKDYDFFFITDLPVKDRGVNAIERFIRESDTLVRLVDHHKTNLWLNSHDWAEVTVAHGDVLESAATLFHDYLMDTVMGILENRARESGNHWTYMNIERTRAFAELVRSYDTWAWTKEGNPHGEQAKRMNNLLYLIGENAFVHRMFREDFSIAFDKSEELILAIEENRCKEYVRKKIASHQLEKLDDERYFVFVEADSYPNEVSDGVMEALQEQGVSPEFIVLRKGGRLSFRTRGSDYDVSALAKYFFGGGHKQAAGGKIENPHSVSNNRFFDKVRYYHKQATQEVTQ